MKKEYFCRIFLKKLILKLSKYFNIIPLIVSLLALLFFFMLTSVLFESSNGNSNSTNSNKYYTSLQESQIEQIKKDSIVHKDEVFHPYFLQNDFERKLIIISKNPEKWMLKRKLFVEIFPKDKKGYESLETFNNEEGFFEILTTIRPVMRTDGMHNYSMLEINLPIIDIEKIRVHYRNGLNHSFDKPFPYLDYSVNTSVEQVFNKDLYQAILHQVLKENDISFFGYKKDSLYKTFSKLAYIDINETSLGSVKDKSNFWKLISKKDASFLNEINFIGKDKNEAKGILEDLYEGKIAFSEAFDLEKLATFFSILNLFGANDNSELTFVYNRRNNILEPIYTNTDNIGVLNTYLKEEGIENKEFLKLYVQKLNRLSNISIEELIERTPNLSKRIKNYNFNNPTLLFKTNILAHNKLVINKGIDPAIFQTNEFLDMTKKEFRVSISNFGIFPVEIKGLYFNKKKFIASPKEHTIIDSNSLDTITFKLPRSFENLFTHKKKKIAGFVFEKDIEKLSIKSSLLGSNTTKATSIVPYQPDENYDIKEDLFRQKIDLSDKAYIKIDSSKNTIRFEKDFTLDKPLVLPNNFSITANPGITINIVNGGKIISHAPLHFAGSKEKPIRIISNDKKGQGILVVAEGEKSTLTYVSFEHLTNPSHGMWSTTSAVTFYESPVTMNNCLIKNSYCEDALNIVRANFTLSNTTFEDIQSDAFDGDFVEGTITSCYFSDLGNDAIDISGSQIEISDIHIDGAGDKGISVGENSSLIAENVKVNNTGIAVASKDLSFVEVKTIDIKNTKLAFTAFQKKPEFGASKIIVKDLKTEKVETKYLIENTSSLVVEGDTIKTEDADVRSRMYGVDFGVSSKETKNRKE